MVASGWNERWTGSEVSDKQVGYVQHTGSNQGMARGEIWCRATLSTQMIWFRYRSITLIPHCAEDAEDLWRAMTRYDPTEATEALATAMPRAFTSNKVSGGDSSCLELSIGGQCAYAHLPPLQAVAGPAVV